MQEEEPVGKTEKGQQERKEGLQKPFLRKERSSVPNALKRPCKMYQLVLALENNFSKWGWSPDFSELRMRTRRQCEKNTTFRKVGPGRGRHSTGPGTPKEVWQSRVNICFILLSIQVQNNMKQNTEIIPHHLATV